MCYPLFWDEGPNQTIGTLWFWCRRSEGAGGHGFKIFSEGGMWNLAKEMEIYEHMDVQTQEEEDLMQGSVDHPIEGPIVILYLLI